MNKLLLVLLSSTLLLISCNEERASVQGSPDPKGDSGTSCTIQDRTLTCEDGTTLFISDGEKGDRGPKGDKGQKGDRGHDGIDGKDGVDGNRIMTDDIQPHNLMGNNNDLYFNHSNGNFYQKSNDVWTLKANLKGPKGDDGKDGEGCFITPHDCGHILTCGDTEVFISGDGCGEGNGEGSGSGHGSGEGSGSGSGHGSGNGSK